LLLYVVKPVHRKLTLNNLTSTAYCTTTIIVFGLGT